MIDPDRILFIPSTRKGNGTGHLRRCLDWGVNLSIQHLYTLDNTEDENLKNHPLCKNDSRIHWLDNPTKDWDLIVLDNRYTNQLPEEFKGIPVISVDESGNMRSTGSYTLDVLPSLNQNKPNYKNFSFFQGAEKKRNSKEFKKILVTFGGEDPASLGIRVLKSLNQELKRAFEWTIIIPNQENSEETADGVMCLPYVENLREKLWSFDLVITSYGLTAFEARVSEVPVLLLNPGTYHDRLSRESDFTFLKNGYKKSCQSIRFFIERELKSLKQMKPTADQKDPGQPLINSSFIDWIETMAISRESCPVCRSNNRISLGRYKDKSYFQCTQCLMKYMIHFRLKSEIYNKDYFFSEYKAQYGKTYLEDFPHIQKMADDRLQRIKRDSGNILDVGCAYGPFLLKAHEKGLKAWGLEISEDAVKYIKENFPQITVYKGAFEAISSDVLKMNFFDVVTFWYVIEHFQDLDTVLTKANRLLKKGGVLALSTPHASGVSGLFNQDDFLFHSPDDHYTLWDRRSARKVLSLHGFKRIRYHITGHHPERFPPFVRTIIPRSILLQISRFLGWGDTFEIYAVKG